MPTAAAMAASARSLLCFFLRPVFLHGASAGAHLLLALAVSGSWLFAGPGKDGDTAVGSSTNGVGGFRRYVGATRCTTWALAALNLLLAAYSCYLDSGIGWPLDALADHADAAVRAAAWLLLAAYLQFEFGGRRREERFPVPLKLWWALFLLLSLLTVAVHAATSLDGLPVPAHSWALDFVSVLAAVLLLVAVLLGERGTGGSASEEPLLDGATETGGENSSAYAGSTFTGAGFLSALTFSWMGPLLAVGHRKTIGLDDVPDLDPADSMAGLLPSFKTKLDALTGNGTTGRREVTAFKLAKALVHTLRWHVAVTALCALVYNVATYVGPYLIDSLVRYLNGDERYATKGQLLVLTFVAAKVFECLSQQHSCFCCSKPGYACGLHSSLSCTRKGWHFPAVRGRSARAAR